MTFVVIGALRLANRAQDKKKIEGKNWEYLLTHQFLQLLCFECSKEQSKYWVGSGFVRLIFCCGRSTLTLFVSSLQLVLWTYGRVVQVKRLSANIAILLLCKPNCGEWITLVWHFWHRNNWTYHYPIHHRLILYYDETDLKKPLIY